MKAILLAAGLGTRLKPITDSLPKCLVPIHHQPLLGLWIDKLVSLGVREILINTHYFNEQVEQYIDSHPHKAFIKLVYEPKLLGTAGTLIQNRTFWQGDECLVIHADNYCQSNLQSMLRAHQNRDKNTDLTLLLFETPTPHSCGIVKLNEHQVVTEFHEKVANPPGNLASGALFLFSSCVFDNYFSTLKEGEQYELSTDIVPKMVNRIQGWQVDGHYLDIGTPESYVQALKISKT
ncbi:nucleotidyltransferase family protein [Pseudoalteromonas luteoviolacea]|uniref:nucleotidyltransferase family protein n=1 Tax=Pseudoalteromonas luteoviolacea TaxID=43657 RepID=UPI001B3A4745|nr:nucleotidyltransferase family protein [Pseudoalteromonas luteoviolacea]MBQ4879342.1 nucleotidyltransferase family protein [Pseudoalteromonas luteoviolacea]MBQ4908402.1 nucleotidyltransferase family protein [Pseudoalteromonas luteoviolacea]